MTVKVAVCNQKGGVGKTDLSVNLASSLTALGKRVLLVDLDPQGNATHYLTTFTPKMSARDLLMDEKVGLEDVAEGTSVENLDIVPSDLSLNVASVQLVNEVNMQFKLRRKLKSTDGYDYIIMDTPPSLGPLTLNALTAADAVLIPVQSQYLAMCGVQQLLESVELVREDLNQGLRLGGMVLTMYDRRTNLSREVEETVRDAFGEKVFKTMIPVNVRLAESPSHHKAVMLYSPQSTGARAYMNLAQEFLEWSKDWEITP